MARKITPGEIKKVNRQQIYHYIYENENLIIFNMNNFI